MLRNCPECGKLFSNPDLDLCPSCSKEEEALYYKAYAYVRDHPNCTVEEIIKGTGLPRKKVLKFVRKGLFYAR